MTEIMMVVAITGILFSIALPGFRTMSLNTKRTTAINALLSSLSLARAEALKRGGTVAICGLASDFTSCTGNGDWRYGWMVFPDPNGNGARDTGEPAVVDRYLADDPAGRSITAATYGATTGYVLVQAFNQLGTAATITVCDRRGASAARAVTVSGTGRSQASDRDLNDAALTCP